jgi:hypothetical protein
VPMSLRQVVCLPTLNVSGSGFDDALEVRL